MLTQKQLLLLEEFKEELNQVLDKHSKIDILVNLSITKLSKELKISRQIIYKYLDWLKEVEASKNKN